MGALPPLVHAAADLPLGRRLQWRRVDLITLIPEYSTGVVHPHDDNGTIGNGLLLLSGRHRRRAYLRTGSTFLDRTAWQMTDCGFSWRSGWWVDRGGARSQLPFAPDDAVCCHNPQQQRPVMPRPASAVTTSLGDREKSSREDVPASIGGDLERSSRHE